ncbi:Tripartite-type tricarboxylate transporter, receptor component TctC [Variovorax sp. 770b2]|nr:Tripartite-type tricarboxylate transporter, receptor component TctC [Variovorax sp. 770b2]
MEMNNRRHSLRLLGALALSHPLGKVMAQSTGGSVSRLLVGFPPGATGDRIARIVAPVLGGFSQMNLIVENKPGAGGQVAIESAKHSAADGSVLLQTIGSSMVIYPHTYRSLRYDPFSDFVPIGTVATAPIAFVASPNTPAVTLAEALALLKRDSKYGFYGSPASGSLFHFTGVLLQRSLRAQFDHVPYKGSAPLVSDVLGGQVPFAFLAPSDILDLHRSGRLKILAVTGTERASQLPDVPTFAERGFGDLNYQERFSYFLVKGTPPDVVAKYRLALRKTVAASEVRAKLIDAGLEMGEGEPEPLTATMQRDYAKWKQIVKEIGFVAD